MVKRLNAYKVINQLTKITFFINVTKFFRKKRKKITTIRIVESTGKCKIK